jgi:hypothetical protein
MTFHGFWVLPSARPFSWQRRISAVVFGLSGCDELLGFFASLRMTNQELESRNRRMQAEARKNTG